MAVTIRLRRTGCNNQVSFRVVATDSRAPRDGRFLEVLGWYDPKREGENYQLDMERVSFWQGQGAQVSETVGSLLRRARKAVTATA
ncbi:MAG: 30S ribosomal protein S16 [Kiritimatiellae bacterium]|nr:30S ribosomal protein S16 [Kiritimatiellia bacterium]